MSRMIRKIRKWTVEALDLPNDLVFDLPRLTWVGGKQLYIENHRGIVHFSPEALHLRTKGGTLEVQGSGLLIKEIMPEEIVVEGKITGFNYREAEGSS